MERQVKKALKAILGKDGFSEHPSDTEAMSYDASGPGFRPEVVLWPKRTDQVAGIIELANRHCFPVIPRGAGSGLTGGSLVLAGGAVLAFNRMNRILEIDPGDMVARVEPGVVTAELQAAVEEQNLFYPPDPASRAFSTLGGNLAECAGGVRAVKYGVTRDYVLGLTAVLGSGQVVSTGTRTIKGVVGYDLTRLLVGSEGTLGLITEATLKLLPLPPAKTNLVGLFSDLEQAARAVGGVFKAGLLPVALEFMDHIVLKLVADELPFSLKAKERALILVEVDGSPQAVKAEARAVAKVFREFDGRVIEARDEAEAEAIWAARRALAATVAKIKPGKLGEDVAVPLSKLPALVRGLDRIRQERDLTITAFGHAGDGNVHVDVLFEGQEEGARAKKAVADIFRLTLDLGGTLSGEHGIGTTKARFLNWELSPLEIEFMLRLKALFDPKGILNPGKIFPQAGAGEQ
ncbi:MAG: FAD-binding protein [Deltaproteobacteria bacterium]|nr:FAD-binding protein [Deltaproteobacteria bacterium]